MAKNQNNAQIDLNSYVNREIPCSCGHSHFPASS